MADETKQIMAYELETQQAEAKLAAFEAKLRATAERLERQKDDLTFASWRQGEKAAADVQYSEDLRTFHQWRDEVKQNEQATRGLGDAVVELAANKRSLATIVSMLGGQFGGLIGQLSALAVSFMTASKALLTLFGGVAIVTALTAAFTAFKESVAAAVSEQERLNEAILKNQAGKAKAAAGIGEELAKFGEASPERVKEAQQMSDRLRKSWGTDSAQVAAIAAAAGMSEEDAAALGTLSRRGVSIENPQQAADLIQQAKSLGTFSGLVREAADWSRTPGGQAVIARAMVPGATGSGALSAEDTVYNAWSEQGLLEGMSREEAKRLVRERPDLVKRLNEVRRNRAMMAADPRGALFSQEPSALENELESELAGSSAFWRAVETQRGLDLGMVPGQGEVPQEGGMLGGLVAHGAAGIAMRPMITQYFNQISIGTQNNGTGNSGLRRMKNSRHLWGGSRGVDIRATN